MIERRSTRRIVSLAAAIVAIVVAGAVLAAVFRDAERDSEQVAAESLTPTSGTAATNPSPTATGTLPTSTPSPVGRFHQSLVADPPESYLLRTEQEVQDWAASLINHTADPVTEVAGVDLMTQYDHRIADVANGTGMTYRDPDDTPFWRVEFSGAPLPRVHMHCSPPGSGGACPASGATIIWVRASNGEFDGEQFRPDGNPSIADLATPIPSPTLDPPVDPTQPLLDGAEIVHIVSVAEGTLRFVQSEVDPQPPLTTDTWLNRTTGEAVIRETRANGVLESLTILRGTTLERYLAESYDATTDTPRYTHFVTQALSADDPAIRLPTAHLDWYRDALARGHAYVVAEEEYDGQPALEVQVAAGTDAQHVAYLDPEYLLPLAVVLTNSQTPEWNGVVEKIRYLTIETFAATDIPAGAFDTTPPDADRVPRQITSRQLTFDDARAFGDYALWAPGASFAGYDLVAVEQNTDTGADSAEEDTVTFVYQRGDDRATQVRITCYGRIRDDFRNDYTQRRIEGSEEIATPSGPAWLWENSYLEVTRVDLDRDGTLVVIVAPDRASGLAVADALRRIN